MTRRRAAWPRRPSLAVLASRLQPWLPELIVVFTAVVLLPAFAWIGVTQVDFNDVSSVYRAYGQAVLAGVLPYRDVAIEYPPASLPLFVVPALISSSFLVYAIVFAAIVGGLGMVGLAFAARIGTLLAPPSRPWLIRTVTSGFIVGLLGSVALTRFDFVPAALTIVAMYALLKDRYGWAGLILGGAIAVKLYPAVILPIAAVYVLRRASRGQAARFVAFTAVIVAASYLPFILYAPDGVLLSIRGQVERSLQIESTGASIYWLGVLVGLWQWPAPSYYDLRSPTADTVQSVMTLAGLVVLALLAWAHARAPTDGHRLVRYSLAALTTFIVFGKVLSPQYLLWLVVFIPALRGAGANAVTALLAAASLATAIYFPRWFPALVDGLATEALTAIGLRNLLLALVLVALLWHELLAKAKVPIRAHVAKEASTALPLVVPPTIVGH